MALTTEHKIYIGAGILVVLGGGVYLSQQSQKADDKSHAAGAGSASLPQVKLAAEDIDKITKVEIKNEAKTDVVLEKRGDKWAVTKPVDYPANQANVKSLLDNMKELKTKEQVETSAASYADYNLDDGKGVHVTALKGADSALDLTFGKSGGRGQLMRKTGTDGVFAVSGYSGYLYTREIKNWRDTEVLKFDDTAIVKIDLKNENGEFHFKKDGDAWSATTAKDAKLDRFDDAKAKDFLRAFKALSADDFADGKSDADLGLDAPVATLVFTPKEGDAIKLNVGKQSNGESRFFKKDGNPQGFSMSSWAAGWATAKIDKFQKADDKKGAGGAGGSSGAKKDDKKKLALG